MIDFRVNIAALKPKKEAKPKTSRLCEGVAVIMPDGKLYCKVTCNDDRFPQAVFPFTDNSLDPKDKLIVYKKVNKEFQVKLLYEREAHYFYDGTFSPVIEGVICIGHVVLNKDKHIYEFNVKSTHGRVKNPINGYVTISETGKLFEE